MLIGGIKISPVVDCIKVTIQGENLSDLSNIFEAFGEKKINIWFEVQIKNREDLMNVTLCVDPQEIEKGTAIIRENYPHLDVSTIRSVNIISVFPYRDNPEIAFLFLKALEDKSVPVLAVSTSLSSIACLIPHEHCSTAKESLGRAFGLT